MQTNENPEVSAVLSELADLTRKVKDFRSLVNEMWAMPAQGGGQLDEAIQLEVDRLADCTEDLIEAYQMCIEEKPGMAREIITRVRTLSLKATSAALNKIAEEMRAEADAEFRFHYFRRGDWSIPLEARSEGSNLLKDARRLWEPDKEEAIESFKSAIESFENAATLARRGGFGWINIIVYLLPIILALVALSPLADSIRRYLGQFFAWIWGLVFR